MQKEENNLEKETGFSSKVHSLTNDTRAMFQDANQLIDGASQVVTGMNELTAAMFQDANQLIDGASQVVTGMNELTATYTHMVEISKQTDLLRQLSAERMEKLKMEFLQQEHLLDKCFGEREKAFSAQYNVLHHALQTNDREMIIKAMQNISTMVVKNPLEDIAKFMERFENEEEPLLDF